MGSYGMGGGAANRRHAGPVIDERIKRALRKLPNPIRDLSYRGTAMPASSPVGNPEAPPNAAVGPFFGCDVYYADNGTDWLADFTVGPAGSGADVIVAHSVGFDLFPRPVGQGMYQVFLPGARGAMPLPGGVGDWQYEEHDDGAGMVDYLTIHIPAGGVVPASLGDFYSTILVWALGGAYVRG